MINARAFERVRATIDAARAMGSRVLPDGTELIGHLPQVGPDAWLHVVFAPLSREELDAIISDLALDAGLHVEFMQAIPLFESELDYKKAHGTPALLEYWRLHQVPFWNPTRTPNP